MSDMDIGIVTCEAKPFGRIAESIHDSDLEAVASPADVLHRAVSPAP